MSAQDDDELDAVLTLGHRLNLLWAVQAVRDGLISVEGRTTEEIAEEAIAHVFRLAMQISEGGSPDWGFRYDHEPTLAAEAAQYEERGLYSLALVLHATRIEHWLNHMISWATARRGHSSDVSKQVVREVGLRGKTGWLWQLLFDDPLPAELVAQIHAIAEQRNAFLHYKWQPRGLDEPINPDSGLEELSGRGAGVMDALKALEDQLIFAGKKYALAEAMVREFADLPGGGFLDLK